MTFPISPSYAELDAGKYTVFHKKLLQEKGGEFQLEFLNELADAKRFVDFVRTEVPTVNGESVAIVPSGHITEQSFKDPPKNVERTIYECLKDIPPRVACKASFWAEVTLRHIEEGVITDPRWLVANGGQTETGAERIEKALVLNEKDQQQQNKSIDRCVRTALRRMSGLPARGNRSVFVDAPFARAWWRERLVTRILERGAVVEDQAALVEVVKRQSQTYWERLVTMIVSRGSVLGSVDVQDAFINSLAKRFREDSDTALRSASTLTNALRRFSAISAARELGALEFDEIGAVADELLARF